MTTWRNGTVENDHEDIFTTSDITDTHDGLSFDTVGQTDVDDSYFYIPLSSEYEHEADENMAEQEHRYTTY